MKKNKHILLSAIFMILSTSVFAQFSVIIGNGTSSTTSRIPFYGNYDYGWSAILIDSSELSGPANLTGLHFQKVNTVGGSYYNQRIYLLNTNDSYFSSSGYINPNTVGASLVYNGTLSFTIPAGFQGVTFQSPFLYTGGNLLILYENRDGSGVSTYYPTWATTPTSIVKAKYQYSNYSFNTSSGYNQIYRPNMKIFYSPADSNDLVMEEWLTPQSGASISSAMPISVKIRNFGLQSQTGFIIKYSVDNGFSWTSQTISSPIAPGTSQNYTFSVPANMSSSGTYSCLAVVKNVGDVYPSNDTIKQVITVCNGGYSGTYEVGNSSTADFHDLQTAINSVSSCGLGGPLTLKIDSGAYMGQVVIPYITGMNSSNTLTIETKSGQKDVVLVANPNNTFANDNYTLKIDSARYLTLRNLTIQAGGDGLLGSHAVFIEGAEDCKLLNCIINGYDIASLNDDFASIFLYYNSSYQKGFKGNTIQNCTITDGSIGILAQGSSNKCQGNKIINNTILDYRFKGVYAVYSDSIVLKNNIIKSDLVSNGFNIMLNNCNSGIDISSNTLEIVSGKAVYLSNCDGTSTDPIKIYNNMIFGHPVSSTIYGIDFYSGSNAIIDYNSIYFTNPNNNTSNFNYCLYIKNSTISSCRNNSLVTEALGYSTYGYNSTISNYDYNNFYSIGPQLAYHNGNMSTLSNLKTATSDNYNSINTTNAYYSPDNLHSNSVALDSAGTSSSVITTDFDGQTRSTTSPDIGADEFSIMANDISIINFLGLNNQCAGIPLPIIAEIKNYGSSVVTSADIHVIINNTVLNQSWSGYISPNSISNVYLGLYSFDSDSTYNIMGLIDSVNGVVDQNPINDTFLIPYYKTSLSGNYTIGSGGDFASIQNAISAMNNYGLCGPVIFNILSGTYVGNYVLDDQISGISSTNTVTFRSASGDTSDVLLIHSSSSSLDNYIFKVENGEHFIFSNLKLKSTDSLYNTIFYLVNSANVDVDSCLLIHPKNTQSIYSRSVYIYAGCNNISVKNSTLLNANAGIYILGLSYKTNTTLNVVHNKILDFYDYGIFSDYSDSVYISKNIVRSRISDDYLMGISVSHLPNKLIIERNDIKVYGNDNLYGIYLNYVNHNIVSTTAQISVFNNFSYVKSTVSNEYVYAFYSNQTDYLKVYFNTFKSNNISDNASCVNLNFSDYVSFKNNNVYSSYKYALDYNGSILSSDYNNLYTESGDLIKVGLITYYANLSNYVTATGFETHSKSVDPGFLAEDDLHIFSTYLSNAGIAYMNVNEDIDGEQRSLYIPDIGADEYDLFSHDVLPIAVNLPKNITSIGPNTIKVGIKNQGSSTLTSVNIYYRLDGGSIDSNYWTGSLPFLSIENYINLGSETLTLGSHMLEVWTKNPNGQLDQNHSNDTLVYTFNAIQKPIIEFSPTHFIDTVYACNVSLAKPITVFNTGTADLSLFLDSNQVGIDSIRILSVLYGYESAAYSNTKAIIQSNISNSVIAETTTSDVSTLDSLLVGKDIVLIPRIDLSSSSSLNVYASFGASLQNFVSNGGTVIFLGSIGLSADVIWNTGLFSGTYEGYLSTGMNNLDISILSHPIFNGFTSSSYGSGNYYAYYQLTNIDNVILSTYGSNVVTAERSIGYGKAILFGFDNTYTSTASTSMLINAIHYVSKNKEFVVNDSLSQVVSSGDSAVFNVLFNTNGLKQGWYYDQVKIAHNDINQPDIIIPCSLYVKGAPELSLSRDSISFGSMFTGKIVTDSVYIYNTGCSMLYINGVSSNHSALVPITFHDTISPGDSALFYFQFSPPSVSSYSMLASISSNDSIHTITFSGNAIPSPQLELNPNPLNVNIDYCNDSIIKSVYVKNSGAATLDGYLSEEIVLGDSLEVLLLSFGVNMGVLDNMINGFSSVFDRFILTQSSINNPISLQNQLQNKDVVVIPYINNSSYLSVYSSFTNVLQDFVTNGGIIIYGGQNYSNYLTNNGFFSGVYQGAKDYVNLSVNTNHPITEGMGATTYIGNEDFFYYNLSGMPNLTNLLTYSSNYTCTAIRPYGEGYAIYLGFHYYYASPAPQYAYKISSNSLRFAYDHKHNWIKADSTYFSILPGDSSLINLAFNATGLKKGQYSAAVKFYTNVSGGSTSILPCSLNVNQELNLQAFLGPDTINCDSYTMDAGIGYSSYLWSTGDTGQVLTVNSSGSYVVTISDGGNCASRDTAIITINPLPIINILGLPTIACTNGNSVQISGFPNGGSFSGNGVYGTYFNPTIANVGPHNIIYNYTDTLGCANSDTQTVMVYDPPNVHLSGLSSSYCPQGSPSVIIGTPQGGTFSGNGVVDSTFSPQVAGVGGQSIFYNYTDSHGCSNVDTIFTMVLPYTNAMIGGVQPEICFNDSALTFSSNISGTSYSGNGVSGNSFNPANAGIGLQEVAYTYTDSNSCIYYDTLLITVLGLPNTIASNDTVICRGDSVQLIVTGASSNLWSTGDTGSSVFVSPMITTEYYVISYQHICSKTDSILVAISNPNPDLGNDTTICGNHTIVLDPGVFSTYFWSTSSTNPFITVDSSGVGYGPKTITVEVSDSNGCTNSDTIVITFKNCTGIEQGAGEALSFKLYPNPSDGLITLSSSATALRKMNYRIVDIAGTEVLNGVMDNSTGFFSQPLDLRYLAKGIYLIHLQGGDQTATLRITLQ